MKTTLPEFLLFLKQNKKISNNTLLAYESDLLQLQSHLLEHGNQSCKSITSEKISDYLMHRKKLGICDSTIMRNIASIKAYFDFLVVKKVLSLNPAKKIPYKNSDKKLPKIITDKEVKLLLDQPNASTVKGIRDKAILELMYATGMKVTEIIDIKIGDVSTELEIVRCSSGEKERVLPLYPIAVKAIEYYIANARNYLPSSPEETTLFINFSGEKLTRQGLWKIIKSYQQAAGISSKLTPQILRNSFAAHLLENGADLVSIKEMLGHTDISTTSIFTKVVKNKYKDTYLKCHPRA